MYKSYTRLRPLAIFACIIGVLQSLTWIGLSVVGIVAYYCQLHFRGMEATLGTVTGLVMFHNYFHGKCPQEGLPNMDYGALNAINLIQPLKIHICLWIYLGIGILWFISSITLITNVRYAYLRHANLFLYFWIALTTAVSILDLGLGIALGLDYDTLRQHSNNISLDQLVSDEHPQFIVLPAKSATLILMSIVFRGYILWLINVALCIYFFTQTLKISDYNRLKLAISNPAFVASTNSLHHAPIDAYGPSKNDYWVDAFAAVPNNHTETDNAHRPGRSSAAATLYAERKQHYDAQQINFRPFEQTRPSKRHRDNPVANVVREINYRQSIGNGHAFPNVPVPDYSPSLPRVNNFDTRPPLRSALRSSRY